MHRIVSYIVPVYNGAKTIESCIESILRVPFMAEVIVIDDGSTDNTSSICEQLMRTHKNILYYRQENSGVSAARNKGIELSTGDYIGFVDCDDEVKACNWNAFAKAFECIPNVIMFEYSEIAQGKEKIIHINYECGLKNQQCCLDLISRMLDYPLSSRSKTSYMGGKIFQYLYKRDFILDNEIKFNQKLVFAEDLCFLVNLLSINKTLYYLPECAYSYYIAEGSASHKLRKNFWKELKNTYKTLENTDIPCEYLSYVYYYFAKTAWENYFSYSDKMKNKELKNMLKQISNDKKLAEEIAKLKHNRDVPWTVNEIITNACMSRGWITILIKWRKVCKTIKRMFHCQQYKIKQRN